MRIVAKRTLREFWQRHPDSEEALLAWYREARNEDWNTPADVKARYPMASIVAGNRVVFNVKGNRYRLVAKINYQYKIVYIRFIGTHAGYDRIDVEVV